MKRTVKLTLRYAGSAIVAFVLAVDAAQCQAPTVAQSTYSFREEVVLSGQYFRGKSGPNLNSTNYAGWDAACAHYFTPLIGLTADFEGDYGRAPVPASAALSQHPLVYQHTFMLGPQFRWWRNGRYSSSFRVLAGGVDVVSDSETDGRPPAVFGLYPNATKFAMKFGGGFEVNISPRMGWQFAPSTVIERVDGAFDREFTVSTGPVFRFERYR